jgi:hypothetical protein
MILEAPLDLSPITQRGEPVVVTSLGEYSCQGVHLREISFRPKAASNRRELAISAVLWNDKGRDKEVDMSVSLLKDGGVLASLRLLNIDAEEKSKATKTARMVLPASDVDNLSELTLHVEMAVTAD